MLQGESVSWDVFEKRCCGIVNHVVEMQYVDFHAEYRFVGKTTTQVNREHDGLVGGQVHDSINSINSRSWITSGRKVANM